MFVDSHCHLNLSPLSDSLDVHLQAMREQQVSHALCVSVEPATISAVIALAEAHPSLFSSVGVHPDHSLEAEAEITVDALCDYAHSSAKVVAIGETGLDYYRLTGDLAWQRTRFRRHIQAARRLSLPLIVHTRAAAEDTLCLLAEEGASEVGGVMHCFTESWPIAEQALALNFYISISGIVTFKNAKLVKEVAMRVPLDRLLIETDAPYLAPVPFRGQTNHPALVVYVAEEIARLRDVPVDEIAAATSANFFRLFKRADPTFQRSHE